MPIVCLSINQASSIQSIGGTCESITIGHNPFQLPLSMKAIFLDRQRPMYLCERMLTEMDVQTLVDKRRSRSRGTIAVQSSNTKTNKQSKLKNKFADLEENSRFESDIRSAAALQGAYHNLNKEAHKGKRVHHSVTSETSQKRDPVEEILSQVSRQNLIFGIGHPIQPL